MSSPTHVLDMPMYSDNELRAAVAAERERCVRVVNDFADESGCQDMHAWAAAIRKIADLLAMT